MTDQQSTTGAPATTTALARAEPRSISGTFSEGSTILDRLRQSAQKGHLISPTTAVSSVPEGFGVSFATVFIDVEKETYPVAGGDDEGGGRSGKRGLSKSALDRIALAAGVTWEDCRRLDDRSDPDYAEVSVSASLRQLDGTITRLQASKVMDLREGSPAIAALWARYDAKKKRNPRARSPEGQIREMRLHIAAHAETKARLRLVRSLGVRTSYDVDELRKPFIVAKLSFTGQSEDPEIRRAFAMKIAESALSGGRMLFGAPEAPVAVRPPPALAPRGYTPPPVGSVPLGTVEAVDDEDLLPDPESPAAA